MILNIRGTNGSGKSHIVKELLRLNKAEPILKTISVRKTLFDPLIKSEILGYRIPKFDLYIVGSYTQQCGGCDRIRTQEEVRERITEFSKLGNVLFEGVVVSTIVQKYIQLTRSLKKETRWLFMDTPLEVCLQRIQNRNSGKEVNVSQITTKYNRILRQRITFSKAGEKIVIVDHNNPMKSLRNLLEI